MNNQRSQYEEAGQYIAGLESTESALNSTAIYLKWLGHYAYKQDGKLMGDIIFDMGTVNSSKDICPNLIEIDDAEILNYSGNIIDGQPELLQ